jgi:hypothetical protein
MESKSKQTIWIQYLIIFLRAVAFAAVAFALVQAFRPWQAPGDGRFPDAPRGTHRVVLIDLSRGMELRTVGGTSIDAALSLSRKLVRSSAAPGRIDLVPVGGAGSAAGFDAFPVEEKALTEALGAFKPGDGEVDLIGRLRDAVALFRSHGEFGTRELYILSDFSAQRFEKVEALESVTRQLSHLGVRILGLEYRNPDVKNFALLDFACSSELLLGGQPSLFTVTVANYSSLASASTRLAVRNSKGKVLYETAIEMAAGTQTFTVPITLGPGEATLTASLGEDDLIWDNRLSRSYRVADELQIAVVQNINMTRGFENPREWLNLALLKSRKRKATAGSKIKATSGKDAANAKDQENMAAAAEVVDYKLVLSGKVPEQLATENIVDAHVVILLDIASLEEDQVQALRRYMVRGGTVLLGPGPETDASAFNQTFAAIAPCTLTPPSEEKLDPAVYESCLAERLDDPLIRELEAPQHGNIGTPRFYNHYGVVPGSLHADASQLLALSGGSPLLVERSIGRGRCLLWTAGLGSDWHSLVVHPGYPVMLVRLLTQAAADREFALNLNPGDPIIRSVDGAQVTLIRPDGTRELISTESQGEGFVFRTDKTRMAGDYTLLDGSDDTAPAYRYHVSEDRSASDIRALSPKARAGLEEVMGQTIATDEAALAAAAGEQYRGASLGILAAAVALICLLLEAGLARRFFA